MDSAAAGGAMWLLFDSQLCKDHPDILVPSLHSSHRWTGTGVTFIQRNWLNKDGLTRFDNEGSGSKETVKDMWSEFLKQLTCQIFQQEQVCYYNQYEMIWSIIEGPSWQNISDSVRYLSWWINALLLPSLKLRECRNHADSTQQHGAHSGRFLTEVSLQIVCLLVYGAPSCRLVASWLLLLQCITYFKFLRNVGEEVEQVAQRLLNWFIIPPPLNRGHKSGFQFSHLFSLIEHVFFCRFHERTLCTANHQLDRNIKGTTHHVGGPAGARTTCLKCWGLQTVAVLHTACWCLPTLPICDVSQRKAKEMTEEEIWCVCGFRLLFKTQQGFSW